MHTSLIYLGVAASPSVPLYILTERLYSHVITIYSQKGFKSVVDIFKVTGYATAMYVANILASILSCSQLQKVAHRLSRTGFYPVLCYEAGLRVLDKNVECHHGLMPTAFAIYYVLPFIGDPLSGHKSSNMSF